MCVPVDYLITLSSKSDDLERAEDNYEKAKIELEKTISELGDL